MAPADAIPSSLAVIRVAPEFKVNVPALPSRTLVPKFKIAEDKFEIVSADSVQVYRYMDIGSAKPAKEERASVPHYLIDIVYPDYSFTAGDFCRLSSECCRMIFDKKKVPLFVGGAGLYIDSFFKGISDIPEIPVSIKKELKNDLAERGISILYEELSRCDAQFAKKIHRNDTQRILRGLEVYRYTKKPISHFYQNRKSHESDDTLYLGIYEDRDILYKKIERRVDSMIESGLINEVIRLREMGYNAELKSMNSIGYSEINKFIDGIITKEHAVSEIKKETRRYAKRQMTWFRRNKKIAWFKAGSDNHIDAYIKSWWKK